MKRKAGSIWAECHVATPPNLAHNVRGPMPRPQPRKKARKRLPRAVTLADIEDMVSAEMESRSKL